jgi:hypothetical protein
MENLQELPWQHPDSSQHMPSGNLHQNKACEFSGFWSFEVEIFHSSGILCSITVCRGQLKCDGTRTETRFRLSVKRTSPFKSAGASVQSTTGGQGVRINGSNAGYTMFRGSVKGTGYPLHSPVSPSLPLPCITVCHHISTGVYRIWLETIEKHYETSQ